MGIFPKAAAHSAGYVPRFSKMCDGVLTLIADGFVLALKAACANVAQRNQLQDSLSVHSSQSC